MFKLTRFILGGALLPIFACSAQAVLYRHITAESSAGASIGTNGALTESSVTYPAIFTPSPRETWCRLPWLSPSMAFKGSKSIGMEILPQAVVSGNPVDKVNHRISSGNDTFALGFGVKRYTGFALYLPSANFDIPAPGKKLMVAQWWQGSPYGPPLRIAITDATTDEVTFRVWVMNNDTKGNPSSVPIDIGGGTIPFDTWTSFVVMTIPNHTAGGEVKVWLNGTQIITWVGKLGYDPTTIPYTGAPTGTANPNPKFDVFYGPYRERQEKRHQMFFDEIKFASTYAEAVP
jgi:hypothetical protein